MIREINENETLMVSAGALPRWAYIAGGAAVVLATVATIGVLAWETSPDPKLSDQKTLMKK